MDTIKEFLSPSSFNQFGFVVVICSVGFGIILLGAVADLETNEQSYFSCRIKGEEKEFLQRACFAEYQAKTTRGLPLYGFVLLNFLFVTMVCLFYSQSVRSKVKNLEDRDLEMQANQSSHGLYRNYCIQLAVRFALGMTFLVLQWGVFYPIKFPSQYTCDLQKNPKEKDKNMTSGGGANITRSWYDCHNPQAAKKTYWTIIVFTCNVFVALFVLLELIYVTRKAQVHESFRKDLDFFNIHLKNKNQDEIIENYKTEMKQNIERGTKFYEPILPNFPGEEIKLLELDKIYTNLIVCSGRVEHEFKGERHEIMEGYVMSQQQNQSIDMIEDIFAPTSGDPDERPRSIMIIGRPGIGKSLLCRKILRDWACGQIFTKETEIGECFEFVYLFKFRHFNSDEKMNLQQLLEKGQFSGAIPNEIYSWILHHPEKVLLIFDGLDEFGKKENITKEDEFGCMPSETIPFAALYTRLTLGKLLEGATVVTTSRPTALSYVAFPNKPFDRTLEILGFNPEQIGKYVENFCEIDLTKQNILNHINSNINLLSLCYIPVNCHILCFSLLERLKQNAEDSAIDYLPTTLTEIYEEALMVILCKHNPQYRCTDVSEQRKLLSSLDFPPEVEKTLESLGEIAHKGIEENRLIFESNEVKNHEESGVLHQLPDRRIGVFRRKEQYCFLHLTMQEFLAARYIVKGKSEAKLQSWISEHLHEGKWEVVLQFVAGLALDTSTMATFLRSLPVQLSEEGTWPQQHDQKELVIRIFKCIFENSRNSNDKWKGLVAEALSGVVNVNLRSTSITDADLTSIVFVLQAVKSMGTVDVSRNHITSNGCLEISKLLTMSGDLDMLHTNECKLTKLDISGNQIGDDGLKHLSDALATNECKLTKLDISANDICDDGLKHLSDALSTNECKLTKLDIKGDIIGDGGLKHLSHALATNECKLTKLDISCNYKISDDGLKHLSNALATNECYLTKLDISHAEIGDGGLKHLSDALSTNECKLTKLNINVNQIGDDGLKHLSDALATNECKLTKLDFRGNKIADDGLKHLSDALATNECKLTKLDISYNGIGDDGLKHLSDALATNECKLTKLDISRTEIANDGVKHLCDALATNECNLSALDVSDNEIGDDGLKNLSFAIATNESKLTKLGINYNQIGDGGLKHLSDALATSECKLTKLNIRENIIGDGGLKHLSDALATSECKLTKLDIGDNRIRDNGLKHLSDALATSECKLTNLDISSNIIGDGGLKHLSDALAINECKLTELDISGNEIGDDGLKHLSDALATSECKLTKLDISYNNIGDRGLKHLFHALGTNGCKLAKLGISGSKIDDHDGLKHLSEIIELI